MLFSETETAKQNQKFLSISFSASRRRGGGEETQEKCKEIFWFLHTRVRGAFLRFTTQSERTLQVQATTRSARAKWVRAKANTSPPKLEINSVYKLTLKQGGCLRARARNFSTCKNVLD